ncbi:MAG: hypothetical protein WCL05_01410 [Verrucomicrobiota bacterium]
MTTYNLSAFAGAGAQFFDDDGVPLVGGLLYSYDAGTTTLRTTYTTSAGTIANTNPIVLNAGGRTPNEVWQTSGVLLKFVLYNSLSELIGTYDNIPSINDPFGINSQLSSVAGTNSITATASPTLTAYATGSIYSFIAANTNTGAATLSIDGLTAASITKNGSAAISAGDVQAGKMMLVEYDGTAFQLVNNIIYGGSITSGTIVSLTTPMSAANGGTGASTLTANNVILGNGVAAVQFVAPGTSGNALISDGTTWASSTPAVIAPTAIGQVPFSTNGTSYTATQKIVQMTAVASTSGTNIDFTSIPSWVKRITAMFDGVSTASSALLQIQLGTSSGFETTNYFGSATGGGAAVSSNNYSSGILLTSSASSSSTTVRHGAIILTNISGNTWTAQGVIGLSDTAVTFYTGGAKSLAATLTQVRITTVGGTGTFDAGTVNVLYE